jgi:hypothetical protein
MTYLEQIQAQIRWLKTQVDCLKNNGCSGSSTVTNQQPRVIDGFVVDTTGNTNLDAIEVTDVIHGEISPGRYIIAKVNALPYTDEANLTLFFDAM